MSEQNRRYRLVEPSDVPSDEPIRFEFGKAPDEAASGSEWPDVREASFEGHGRRRLVRPVVIGLCAILVIAGGLLLASQFLGKGGEGGLQPDPNVKVGSLTGAGADLDKIAEEAQVSFSINAAPVFETGSASGNLTIENLEMNNNRFTVTINLKEDDREVYRSGYLDPGQYIESAPLSEELPAGTYPAVATIDTFRLSDNTPIGRVAVELVLHVEG